MFNSQEFKDTHKKHEIVDNGESYAESFSLMRNETYNARESYGKLHLLLPQLTFDSPSFKSYLSFYNIEFYT